MASTTAHIHDLAPEVLGLIFLLTTPFEWPGRSVTRDATELLLPRVCHRWKDVAQNTPSLWTPVDITIPLPSLEVPTGPVSETFSEDTLRAISRYTDLVLRWLCHSGEAKLSVNISNGAMQTLWSCCRGNSMDIWEESVKEILKRITDQRFTKNWRQIRIEGIGPTALHTLLDIPASQLQSLEELDFACRITEWNASVVQYPSRGDWWTFQETSENHLRDILQRGIFTAPSLTRLSLANTGNGMSERLKYFPSTVWVGLTHFTMHPSYRIPVTEILGILRHCADTIQFLQVDLGPAKGNASFPTSSISLPRLTEANIMAYSTPGLDDHPYSEYFALIYTPRLSTLRYTWGQRNAEWQGKLPLLAFLEANRARGYLPTNLTHVTLTSYHWSQESEFKDLLDILGGSNSGIRSLSLEPQYEDPELDWEKDMQGHAYFTPDVLKKFHRVDKPLFPTLECIDWVLRFEWEVGPDDLLAFLIHRLSATVNGAVGSGRLQQVSVTFDGRREVATDALYELAADNGLDLNVEFGLRAAPSEEGGDDE